MAALKAFFVYLVMVPISFLLGFWNWYAYRREGEHLFLNNYAEQLTEKVIQAHSSRLRTLKLMLQDADEKTMMEIVNSPGMSPEWPRSREELDVPWLYWLTFWPINHVVPIISEFTRIRVRARVERFLDDPGRGAI